MREKVLEIASGIRDRASNLNHTAHEEESIARAHDLRVRADALNDVAAVIEDVLTNEDEG